MSEVVDFIQKFVNQSDSEKYLIILSIENVIFFDWQFIVIIKTEKQEAINKYNYEIAVLGKLKELLLYKIMWIENSYRYRNFNGNMPQDYNKKKAEYCQTLGLATIIKVFID